MKAQVTFTPAESKRLIAKAVANMREVKEALKDGIVIIALGTTNGYVAEEILGKNLEKKVFAAGIVTPRGTCHTPLDERSSEIVIKKGEITKLRLTEILNELGANDVFIKGANAIDSERLAGIFTSDPFGGTMGKALGVLTARGVQLIIPVGLEKFIPSPLAEIAREAGSMKIDKSMGAAVGLFVVTGRVVTEIEALQMLAGVKAIPIGAGGIGGAEGARTLILEGTKERIEKAWSLIRDLKGEKPLEAVTENCGKCLYNCVYRLEEISL